MNRRQFAINSAAALAAGPALAQPKLDGPRRGAAQAPAKYLIVLLHGFGGDGPDMFGLAPNFQAFVPSAAIVAPNGPVKMDFGGYSWMGDAERDLPAARATTAAATLNAFLDAELARHGLAANRLILVGFSQGSNMALNVGLRRPAPPAAIVGFEGARLDPTGLAPGQPRPPVLIVRGDQDDRVPLDVFQAATRTLAAIGAPTEARTFSNLGHSIDERGLRAAGALLRKATRA